MTMTALEGLRPWILQRLTAVYIALYIIYFVAYWSFFNDVNFENWTGWLARAEQQVGFGLFYLSVLLHAWIGVRDILIDYIKPLWLRLSLYYAVAMFLAGTALWMLKIVLMVN